VDREEDRNVPEDLELTELEDPEEEEKKDEGAVGSKVTVISQFCQS
jgi:hypothetical protein